MEDKATTVNQLPEEKDLPGFADAIKAYSEELTKLG